MAIQPCDATTVETMSAATSTPTARTSGVLGTGRTRSVNARTNQYDANSTASTAKNVVRGTLKMSASRRQKRRPLAANAAMTETSSTGARHEAVSLGATTRAGRLRVF